MVLIVLPAFRQMGTNYTFVLYLRLSGSVTSWKPYVSKSKTENDTFYKSYLDAENNAKLFVLGCDIFRKH